ncbi:hypothetical protein [Aurantimonas sp. 22II-16-19i]|uniref:hypothetical protein n=1 Tax=Aurantimonas sp. 22II-16-19i TaxID=1317114 RepID=UPI0009F7B4CA|nr:hypothetical protein [Aurantimonas sp. 22II-16-19i]ORE97762.1 transposase-like Mu [Aurantimonas sp. 22II-16-19i]
MSQIVPVRHWRFGRADRIVFEGRAFRYIGKKNRTHILQRVEGDFMEDDYLLLSDRQVSAAIETNRLRYDTDHFSRQVRMLRARFDTSRIDDLDAVARMQLLWRYEWVREARNLIAMNGNGVPEIGRTGRGLDLAVAHLSDRMENWFEEAFRDLIPDLRTKDYPAVPAGSTLYAWIRRYEDAGLRIEGLRDARERCGRGGQLHEDVLEIIRRRVEEYRSALNPRKAEIVRRVHDDIWQLNRTTGSHHAMTSPRIVREHIERLDQFLVDAARQGCDKAINRHAGVGRGVVVDRLLQRIEMDDWEFDLQVLLCTAAEYENATPAQLRQIQRVRPTASVAIDAYSRTIVGFHLSPYPPSSAGSIACLRSVMVDKTPLAELAGCGRRDSRDPVWRMFGRPETIVTDGGPAFDSTFDDVGRACGSNRSVPEKDPRLRGRIERWFGTLQDGLLHNFSGRTFANSVERGDYDSESQASLTFEELYIACVRYIVDDYHRAQHSGLMGRSPANFWQDALENDWKGVTAFATPEEMRYAFTVRHLRRPSTEGIRFLNLQYWSEEFDIIRPALEGGPAVCRVDPLDLSSILVDLPDRLRKDPRYEKGPGFLVVPHKGPLPDLIRNDPTLENWVQANAMLREIVAEEAEEERPIRVAARKDLWSTGQHAMERAGVLRNHELTAEMLKRFQDRLDRKRRNAARNPADRKKTDAAPHGRSVATADRGPLSSGTQKTAKRPKPAAPRKPAGKAAHRQMFSPEGGNDPDDIKVE